LNDCPVDLASTGISVDVAMAMYQQEREDERAFRSLQVSLRQKAIVSAGVAALVSKEAGSACAYASVPFLVMPLLAMFLPQAAAGRRHYMAALAACEGGHGQG
jgi:hypothetical protein